MKSSRNTKGKSNEQIQQSLEESIRIQALKYNPNPMLGTSPLSQEGIIHDINFLPFIYFDIPTQDANQLRFPIVSYGCYYIKSTPLDPTDDPETIIRTYHERLRTFYSTNAWPPKGSVV